MFCVRSAFFLNIGRFLELLEFIIKFYDFVSKGLSVCADFAASNGFLEFLKLLSNLLAKPTAVDFYVYGVE